MDSSSNRAFIPYITYCVQCYCDLLSCQPLMTKSVTGGVLAAIGNIISQKLKERSCPSTPPFLLSAPESSASESSDENNVESRKDQVKVVVVTNGVDLRSVAAFFFYGLVVIGPLTHYFYRFLEKMFPKNQTSSKWLLCKKMLIDRFLFTPFLCFCTVSSLEIFQV
jgi:hypothetical protein